MGRSKGGEPNQGSNMGQTGQRYNYDDRSGYQSSSSRDARESGANGPHGQRGHVGQGQERQGMQGIYGGRPMQNQPVPVTRGPGPRTDSGAAQWGPKSHQEWAVPPRHWNEQFGPQSYANGAAGGFNGPYFGHQSGEFQDMTNTEFGNDVERLTSPWIVPARTIIADRGWSPATFQQQFMERIGNLENMMRAPRAQGAEGIRRFDENALPEVVQAEGTGGDQFAKEAVEGDPETDYGLLQKLVNALMKTSDGALKAKKLCRKFKISLKELDDLLSEYPGIIIHETMGDSDGDAAVDDDDVVKLVPVLELCSAHNENACTDRRCRKLHLCKVFALKHECKNKCRRCHDLNTKHNCRALQKVLEIEDVRKFTKQFTLNLVTYCLKVEEIPDSEGSEGSDEDSDDDIGSKRGLTPRRPGQPRDDEDTDSVSYRSVSSRHPRPGSPDGAKGSVRGGSTKSRKAYDVLCIDNAKGHCRSKKCSNIHGHVGKLYVWQICPASVTPRWLNLNAFHSDKLETAFADAHVSSIVLDPLLPAEPDRDLHDLLQIDSWRADFSIMTISSVDRPGRRPMGLRRVGGRPVVKGKGDTKWQWFFKNNNDKWVVYGGMEEAFPGALSKSDITSEAIEEHFVKELEKQGGDYYPASPNAAAINAHPIRGIKPLEFSTDFHCYKLDFSRMLQVNLRVQKEREVRRRPALQPPTARPGRV